MALVVDDSGDGDSFANLGQPQILGHATGVGVAIVQQHIGEGANMADVFLDYPGNFKRLAFGSHVYPSAVKTTVGCTETPHPRRLGGGGAGTGGQTLCDEEAAADLIAALGFGFDGSLHSFHIDGD